VRAIPISGRHPRSAHLEGDVVGHDLIVPRVGLWLDTMGLTPEETVDRIEKNLDTATIATWMSYVLKW
jgi:hypothetical protein